MSVLVVGYIRPELDYVSKGEPSVERLPWRWGVHADIAAEALIEDINTDAKVALNSLARPSYAALASDPFLAARAD